MFILFIRCITILVIVHGLFKKKKLTSNHTLFLKQFSYLSKIGGRGNNSFEKRPKTPFLDKMFGGKIIVYGSCKKWWHLRWRNIMSSLPTHLLYISIICLHKTLHLLVSFKVLWKSIPVCFKNLVILFMCNA